MALKGLAKTAKAQLIQTTAGFLCGFHGSLVVSAAKFICNLHFESNPPCRSLVAPTLWQSCGISLSDRRFGDASSGAVPSQVKELAAVFWEARCCGQRSCCRGLGAARMVHDLSASCKAGRGFAEPQFPGVISVGLLHLYPTLHFFTVLCLPQEDRRCLVVLLYLGVTPAACGFLTHQEESQTWGFPQRVQELPGLCAEL